MARTMKTLAIAAVLAVVFGLAGASEAEAARRGRHGRHGGRAHHGRRVHRGRRAHHGRRAHRGHRRHHGRRGHRWPRIVLPLLRQAYQRPTVVYTSPPVQYVAPTYSYPAPAPVAAPAPVMYSDGAIHAAVANMLASQFPGQVYKLKIEVKHGEVEIDGDVYSAYTRAMIVQAIYGIPGVRKVDNDLHLKR